MKVHFYLEEKETDANITNFDFAREIVDRCDEYENLDIKTIVSMIMAQIEFVDRENAKEKADE